jgi:GT2 family glycosyltransferase
MDIDCVMLSYTKDESYHEMTQQCIDSLRASTEHNVNIFLVETAFDPVNYSGCRFILQPRSKFGYNRFLNIGFSYTTSPYVLISNNDVIYHEQCLDILVETIEREGLTSASPRCPLFHAHQIYNDSSYEVGYRIAYQLCGWSLLLTRKMLDQINPLDEVFEFEYQDNDMARTMERLGGKHALVGAAKATHLLNQSHRLVPQQELEKMNLVGVLRLHEKLA